MRRTLYAPIAPTAAIDSSYLRKYSNSVKSNSFFLSQLNTWKLRNLNSHKTMRVRAKNVIGGGGDDDAMQSNVENVRKINRELI